MKHSKLISQIVVLAVCVVAVFLWVKNKRQNQTTEGSCLKCECTSLWPYGWKKKHI